MTPPPGPLRARLGAFPALARGPVGSARELHGQAAFPALARGSGGG